MKCASLIICIEILLIGRPSTKQQGEQTFQARSTVDESSFFSLIFHFSSFSKIYFFPLPFSFQWTFCFFLYKFLFREPSECTWFHSNLIITVKTGTCLFVLQSFKCIFHLQGNKLLIFIVKINKFNFNGAPVGKCVCFRTSTSIWREWKKERKKEGKRKNEKLCMRWNNSIAVRKIAFWVVVAPYAIKKSRIKMKYKKQKVSVVKSSVPNLYFQDLFWTTFVTKKKKKRCLLLHQNCNLVRHWLQMRRPLLLFFLAIIGTQWKIVEICMYVCETRVESGWKSIK